MNSVKNSFGKLAQLLDIAIEDGWIKILAKKVEISQNDISNWIYRKKIPENRLPGIEEKSFPREKWYSVPKPYPEPEENIGIPKNQGRDSRPPLYTEPTGVKFVPQALFGPPHPEQVYIDAVVEIFDSGERGTIEALKSNITQFQEQVRDKQRMQDLEKQVAQLTKQLKVEKNGNDSSNNPGDNAENE